MDPSENQLRQRHIRAVASLLQARGDGKGALPGFHGDRYASATLAPRPARSAAEEQERHEELRRQRCSNCGLASVPGWTSSVRVASGKPGRRRRRGRQNTLETTCACGWRMLRPGSDAGTKHRFKRRKLSTVVDASAFRAPDVPLDISVDFVEVPTDARASQEDSQPVSDTSKEARPSAAMHTQSCSMAPRRESPISEKGRAQTASPTSAPTAHSPGPGQLHQPGISNLGKGSSLRVDRAPHQKQSSITSGPARPLPARTASPAPTPPAALAQPPKKKRTKRDGLQAMLAARKEAEAVKEKGSIGSLGLGNFLQGL